MKFKAALVSVLFVLSSLFVGSEAFTHAPQDTAQYSANHDKGKHKGTKKHKHNDNGKHKGQKKHHNNNGGGPPNNPPGNENPPNNPGQQGVKPDKNNTPPGKKSTKPRPKQGPRKRTQSDVPTIRFDPVPEPADRQQEPRCVIMVPPTPEPPVKADDESKTETIVKYVAASALVSLVLGGLGILALFLGYILGQKDAKKNEDNFLRSVIDSVYLRKRP